MDNGINIYVKKAFNQGRIYSIRTKIRTTITNEIDDALSHPNNTLPIELLRHILIH